MTESSVGKQIFLSYAREDSYYAERLYRDLLAYGLNVWWDQRSLLPGQDWDREIRHAIPSSEWFVALISSRSVNKRGVVQREIRQALDVLKDLPEGAVFIIPARLDDCTPTHDRLRQRHWVDLFPNWENGLSQLLRAFGIDRGSLRDANKRLLQAMGLFRHSVLGPVQGLASAAKYLGELASGALPDDTKISLLRSRIDAESQIIRLWRENYQFIDRERINLRPKEVPVDRLIRRTIEEYTSILHARHIALRYDSALPSEATAWVDSAAFVVALSNLVDNAGKYAYMNTVVLAGSSALGGRLTISIENIGSDVPEFIQTALRKPQQLPEADLSSWILERRGFGLEVARAVAEAHGGSLTCRSVAMHSIKTREVEAPEAFRVSFQLAVPVYTKIA